MGNWLRPGEGLENVELQEMQPSFAARLYAKKDTKARRPSNLFEGRMFTVIFMSYNKVVKQIVRSVGH